MQPAAGAYYCGNSWGSRLSAANGLLVVGGNYGTRTYAVASDLTSEVAPMLYAFPGDSSMWFGPEVRLSPSANWLAKYDNRGGLDILRLGSNGWTVANRLTPPANSSIGMWQSLPVDLDDSGLVVSFYGLTLPNGRTDTSAFVIDLDGAAQVTSWRLWRLSESGLYGPGGAQLPTYSSLGAVLLDGREPGSGARTWS